MAEKSKVVWISQMLPYDSVPHAGGKTHNFYVKKFVDSQAYDVRLISFYVPGEREKFTLDQKIRCNLACYEGGYKRILRGFEELNYKYNPFHRFGNAANHFALRFIRKVLKDYKREGFWPELILLQWTMMVLYREEIKKIFPDALIIAIEEDVTFHGYERKAKYESVLWKRKIWELRYSHLKSAELDALSRSDMVILSNENDRRILEEEGVKTPLRVWAPYHDNYGKTLRSNEDSKNLLFFGAMNRPENYLSVIWFVEHVMTELSDTGVCLRVVGGHPDPCLDVYRSERVQVVGFVEDVREEFGSALCMIAPLVLGAGIKVKILEGMSAGLPVLTNSVGIEGIHAKDGKEFLYCENPEDYIRNIRGLLNGSIDANAIGKAAQEMVLNDYSCERTAVDFLKWVEDLLA